MSSKVFRLNLTKEGVDYKGMIVEDRPDRSPEMKYVALDVDIKALRFRVGSSFLWPSR